MSDIVDTSPLGIERTERIAGDDALNSRLDTVTTELQGTQESVTTEVLHRSEGDLVIQRVLEGYIQDLLEGKAEDFERYIEFQNSQNLNYADVRNFVSGIRTSLADDIRNLTTSLMNNLQANDARYDKLVSDVGRYLEILSDITLDSNQITLDNGELRAGAWTILSQARAWDLEIISRLNGLSESVGDSLKDAVEEIQNQLPSTEETITKAIEELSKSPLIKELRDLLNQSIENDIAYELALLEQARKHANEMSQLAEDMRAEALAKAQEMEDYMAGEVTARITEVNKEVAARKEAIDLLTEDMLTRVDQDKADYLADMLATTNRIKSAEDGLTSEIQHRKDGDSSTLNALNTYKVSNDTAITGLSTSLSNNVTKTSANTTLITGLTARMTTAETGIESATTAAADAMSKATTAVSANSALATRVDALAASITDSEDTVVDVNAFNALKAEVNTVKGTVNGLVEDVTALESNYTSVNNKVTSQGTAISTLNTKMSTAENSISQSANDITLLKTDINTVNAGLLTKVDSQAFSQLSSDVTELDDKYTTQASLVTDLRGSLDTTNVNVGNAASAAQNALNTAGSKGKVIFGTTAPAVADRLSQNLWIDTTGGANTPKRWNGSAWVVVTDKVATDALAAANAATNLANTKADTSAFNSLDQKVTVIDGQVSTNTNSITSLNGKIAIVEGGLATKLDSSAIVNYYTKQQADDKALSTAAGEVSKYDASLVIGGVNLIPNSFVVSQYSNNSSRHPIEVVVVSGVHRIRRTGTTNPSVMSNYTGNFVDLPVGTEYTISVKVKPIGSDYSLEFYGVGASVKLCKADQWTTLQATVKAATQPDRIRALVSSEAQIGVWIEVKEWQAEIGNKATAWSPSPSDFQNAIDVNATAITNTNAEVSRVDGRVTTEANRITSLTGRVDTVVGDLAKKADASALSSLTTRVESEEGKSTSQGNAITSLQNTVNHATTGLSTKASSAALTVVDNKVIAVDGRVTVTNSNVATLSGRVSTVEGTVTTKADVTALNALTTRVGDVEGGLSTQANNTTRLEAKIDSKNGASLLPDYYMANHNEWESHYGYDLSTQFTTTDFGNIGRNIFFKRDAPTPSPNPNWNYSKTRLPNNKKYRLSMLVCGSVGAEGPHYFTGKTFDAQGKQISYLSYTVTSQAPANGAWHLVTAIIDWTSNAAKTIAFGFSVGHTGDSSKGWWMVQGFSVKEVVTANDADDTLATTAALTSTNSEVSRIDGVVAGHSTQLTNLTASIAGKADTTALNALTVRVAAEEGKSSSQATSITNLNSSLTTLKRDNLLTEFLDATGGGANYLQVSIPLKQSTYIATGRKITVKGKLSFKHTGALTAAQGLRIFLGGHIEFNGIDLIKQGDDYYFDTMVVANRDLRFDTLNFYFLPNGTANASTQTIVHWAELYFGDQTSKVDLSGKADASALSTLDTKVAAIDGRVTTQASQLVVLTSDNNANKNALTVQGKVIDGVKSSYMVKMETNGVIGGFGIIQSTGAMGTVTTTFGVNANAFFIGAPASKKQPFIVTTANQEVNGVKYPAGTYIDMALIANATIGTAKIADLAVTGAKIANATIDNAKIANLDAAKINTGTLNAARIGANSITSTHINVDNLSAISAKIGLFKTATTGKRVEISDNGFRMYNASGIVVVELGDF